MTGPRPVSRRAALAALSGGLVGSLAGCLSGPTFPDADVVAGPDGEFAFDPDRIVVPVGETVTWGFASSGHNVSGRPDHSDAVALPDGAVPFASYGPDEPPIGSHVPRGETYERTFEVPGRYVYACIPHASQGMVGRLRVGDPG